MIHRGMQKRNFRALPREPRDRALLMRFLPVALFLLAPGLSFAVEHTGTVRAADQFIPGATVTARQGGAKLTTYTDDNGRYALDLTPGDWEIEIKMFGFRTLTA